MKFLYIELENIFAYDRKVRVELSGTSPEKNVVLIWGRNGMGKTSFLNALKLLFLGSKPNQAVEGLQQIRFPAVVLRRRR